MVDIRIPQWVPVSRHNDWAKMLEFVEFLKAQPRDENGETIVVPGRENPRGFMFS